ncbi:peroxisomal membrane protein pex14 [Lecanora helva]
MVREDLINSAVSFLQDPSVATSPLDKRIAFLQSKNLTQEEIDVSLARAGDASQASAPPPSAPPNQYTYQPQPPTRPPPGYSYPYAPYLATPWAPQAPTEPPRRDWRDWFIMATVTTSMSYGLYTLAKRYVAPLISPPTPPQLESDKAAIDTQFARAFDLISQLSTDTAALKETESQRTEKLDTTLKDIDAVVEDLKAANKRREVENRMVGEQIQGLKEQVPKALEEWKRGGDAKLEELGQEMGSLRRLLENRVGRSGGTSTPTSTGRGNTPAPSNSDGKEESKDTPSSSSSSSQNSNSQQPIMTPISDTIAPAPGITASKQNTTSIGQSRDRKAIPAWQRAAGSKSSGTAASEDSSSSGGKAAEAGA